VPNLLGVLGVGLVVVAGVGAERSGAREGEPSDAGRPLHRDQLAVEVGQ
jgi:inner membrane transporter RhtA